MIEQRVADPRFEIHPLLFPPLPKIESLTDRQEEENGHGDEDERGQSLMLPERRGGGRSTHQRSRHRVNALRSCELRNESQRDDNSLFQIDFMGFLLASPQPGDQAFLVAIHLDKKNAAPRLGPALIEDCIRSAIFRQSSNSPKWLEMGATGPGEVSRSARRIRVMVDGAVQICARCGWQPADQITI